MFRRDEIVARLAPIDERLRRIAKAPIDLQDVAWLEKMCSVDPLDAAGVRKEAQDLLDELIDAYAAEDDATRSAIRTLFREFSSFAWATAPRAPRKTRIGFRTHLLHFSIADQGDDPRDARLWLDGLLNEAKQAHLDVGATLQEVAALSSREDRYGWGSTRDWLIKTKQ
jgi:hypothetical protein